MNKLKNLMIKIYQDWKEVQSKKIKVLSGLGVAFPFLLLGVYVIMKKWFPTYLLAFLLYIAPACQSVDAVFLENMERHNFEIVQAHIKDNYDNSAFVGSIDQMGVDFMKRTLNALLAPERSQLRTIYEFWAKVDRQFKKDPAEQITRLIDDFHRKWAEAKK